jgi:hypothetical protein
MLRPVRDIDVPLRSGIGARTALQARSTNNERIQLLNELQPQLSLELWSAALGYGKSGLLFLGRYARPITNAATTKLNQEWVFAWSGYPLKQSQ